MSELHSIYGEEEDEKPAHGTGSDEGMTTLEELETGKVVEWPREEGEKPAIAINSNLPEERENFNRVANQVLSQYGGQPLSVDNASGNIVWELRSVPEGIQVKDVVAELQTALDSES